MSRTSGALVRLAEVHGRRHFAEEWLQSNGFAGSHITLPYPHSLLSIVHIAPSHASILSFTDRLSLLSQPCCNHLLPLNPNLLKPFHLFISLPPSLASSPLGHLFRLTSTNISPPFLPDSNQHLIRLGVQFDAAFLHLSK